MSEDAAIFWSIVGTIAFFVILIPTLVYVFDSPDSPEDILNRCLDQCPDDNYNEWTDLECPNMCYGIYSNLTNCSRDVNVLEDEK